MWSFKFNFVSLLLCLFTIKTSGSLICDILSFGAESEIDPGCFNQLKVLCENGTLLWQMFDASSKYPTSGMSYSNNRDFGNFDECISLEHHSFEGDIMGKFCGLSVAIPNLFLEGIPDPFLAVIDPKNLAQIDSINYTNQRLEQFRDDNDAISLSLLSLCIPDRCTPTEVGKFFVWGRLEEIRLVNFVEEVPCQTKDSNTSFTSQDIVFITFLALIGLAIVWSSCYDYMLQRYEQEAHHPILLSFSVLTNLRKLLQTTHGKNPEQIQCLNGLRSISMMWIIAGHGFVATEQLSLMNYADIAASVDNIRSQYMMSAPISVDTFFFISGLLLTFGYLKSAAKLTLPKHLMGIPIMVIHRYLRLTPALAVVYVTSITIFRLLGRGPLWGAVTTPLHDTCTKYSWSFFLYVQNYYNFDDMCLNHTWYLSADMQMFILAPIVLIPMVLLIQRKRENQVLIGLLVFIGIMVAVPMIPRFLDWSIANVYDTHSRIHIYLVGVLLAVVLRDSRLQRFPFSKLTNLAIWCTVLVVCVIFNLYYHNILRIYEHTTDTLFFGLYRPIWSFSLAWMVYSCYHGHGGVINWILTLPVFQIVARLSYCMYLLHALVEMYWVGLMRTPFFWSHYIIFYNWCGHFIVTLILSLVWTLAFEAPMITITKYLIKWLQTPCVRRKPRVQA